MDTGHPIRTVQVTRYIAPLREGGSLPALVEADDDLKYVLKFRGQGHGPRSLVAELIGGEVARALGLRVPELVFIGLDERFGRTEPDEEVQELLRKSHGLNIGLHFLAGAVNYDAAVNTVPAELASMVVWCDALLTNIDRTVKNPNLLLWQRELWLIDHGSCLYFHHGWVNWERHATGPFDPIKDHVLLPLATGLEAANARARQLIGPTKLEAIVGLVPDTWLRWEGTDEGPDELRAVYLEFLLRRLRHADTFTREADHARQALV
ncbi:MAG: aminotransferase class I and II [Flavobacteriales bacterium]|jgi:hypothetical protein|nr:aminotransferase class I and II [Flavobacteriales bacterium]